MAGKQTLTRPMSESEMAAMLKRQQQLVVQQQKGQVQVAAQAGLTPAQILAQAGLQVRCSRFPVCDVIKRLQRND